MSGEGKENDHMIRRRNSPKSLSLRKKISPKQTENIEREKGCTPWREGGNVENQGKRKGSLGSP